MAEKLTTFAWKHSKKEQVVIVLVTLITFPTIYITLELPKMIINDAIDGDGFPRVFFAFEFDQIPYLFLLCFAYLAAIAFNNGLKFYLNFSRGILGERMLRRMRFELFSKVMARQLSRLRNTSPGEIVQMISAELAPIGDFIGAIFATPMMAGGSFMVYLGFIIAQNPLIGAAALSLYPVQAYLIPKLQAKVVAMITRRLVNIRAMAREISESIDGAVEVRALRTRRWHLAVVSDQLYENYVIRRRIFILKNLIKFVNNVANHLTPFLIFMIGGYFVIEGQLDIGALTAVLIAYKDLAAPWKELLGFYQSFSDMSARYQSVMEQFTEDAMPGELPGEAPQGPHAVQLIDARAEGMPKGVSCHAPHDAVTAVVCENDATRLALLQGMAGVLDLDGGKWTAGQPNLMRSTALVTVEARVFSGSVRHNMLHGLFGYPVAEATDDEAAMRRHEAELTGAPPDDIRAKWISPKDSGYADEDEIEHRLMDLARKLNIENDIYRIGLGSRVDPETHPELAERILDMRKAIADDEEQAALRQEFVDVWDETTYNVNASVGENLFYARPKDATKTWGSLAGDRAIMKALEAAGVRQVLVEIGLDICETLLSLFEAVEGDSELLNQYGLFPKSETPHIEQIVVKAKRRGSTRLSRPEKNRMVAIAFDYSSARYRLKVMRTEGREKQVIAARAKLREAVADDPRITPFDETLYIPAFSLSENIFFGPARLDRRDAWGSFAEKIDNLARERNMRDDIVHAGLDQPVGEGGVSLNAMQRRNIALARALLKNPGALILDGFGTGNSEEDVALRQLIRSELGKGALVYGTNRVDRILDADHVILVDASGSGGVREGSPADLNLEVNGRVEAN
jgi:putative ABC transport system ATP-binding protein